MTKQTTFLALVLASSAFVACGSSSDPSGPAAGGAAGTGDTTGSAGSVVDPTGTGGTSSTAGGASGAGGGTVGCGTFANDGAAVPEVRGVGTMPTPVGGTIADGTYHLTKWEIYPPGSVDAYMRFETWVVSGGTLQAVNHTDSDPDKRTAGAFSSSGSTLTLNVTCPITTTLSTTYTATATTIQFFETGDDQEVHTYTKQ